MEQEVEREGDRGTTYKFLSILLTNPASVAMRSPGKASPIPRKSRQATRVATAQLNRRAKPWVWGLPLKDPRHYRRLFCYRILRNIALVAFGNIFI
jgi:hypothetical protein